jgi:hypothetical protein
MMVSYAIHFLYNIPFHGDDIVNLHCLSNINYLMEMIDYAILLFHNVPPLTRNFSLKFKFVISQRRHIAREMGTSDLPLMLF